MPFYCRKDLTRLPPNGLLTRTTTTRASLSLIFSNSPSTLPKPRAQQGGVLFSFYLFCPSLQKHYGRQATPSVEKERKKNKKVIPSPRSQHVCLLDNDPVADTPVPTPSLRRDPKRSESKGDLSPASGCAPILRKLLQQEAGGSAHPIPCCR